MSPLIEIAAVRQIPGEPRRRWFASKDLDLIVWLDESGAPESFQLCYDKSRAERALTWTPERGFVHLAVDDGETDVGFRYKATPILVADSDFDAGRVLGVFLEASAQLPDEVVEWVVAKVREHPHHESRP